MNQGEAVVSVMIAFLNRFFHRRSLAKDVLSPECIDKVFAY